ncbi:MAG: hypothetical protein IPN77_30115 [Sandaracinaceae bacterium]|nr:hypothetical protein [Sandaracinaceae bacterium]
MKKALPGKAFAVGLVLALIGIIAALLWGYLAGRTLRGEILVELPIPPSTRTDQERVLVRRGFDQRRHLFLLRERDGREVWPARVVLYGLQEGTTPVIAGDLLLVRTRRSSGLHETHAFRVDTGEFVWTGATPLAPLDSTGAPGPTLFLDDVVTEVYEGDPGELIGVNLAMAPSSTASPCASPWAPTWCWTARSSGFRAARRSVFRNALARRPTARHDLPSGGRASWPRSHPRPLTSGPRVLLIPVPFQPLPASDLCPRGKREENHADDRR